MRYVRYDMASVIKHDIRHTELISNPGKKSRVTDADVDLILGKCCAAWVDVDTDNACVRPQKSPPQLK